MKINFIKKLMLASVVVMSLFFVSCATSVKVDVVRPAELDLNGANSIAILPFRPSLYHGHYEPRRGYRVTVLDYFFGWVEVSLDEQHAVNTLKSGIEQGLINSKYLKLISSDVVESAIRNSKDIPADVYLTGEVISFEIRDKKTENKRKNSKYEKEKDEDGDSRTVSASDEPEYITEVKYMRYVDMVFRYQIVDSKTNEIISFKTVSISNNSFEEDKIRDLPSAYSIIQSDLNRVVRNILKNIQPYTVTKYLDLLSYSSKHAEMKYADALADDGYVKEACEKFLEIYETQGIFEAGYNAAMLKEALGDLEEAEALMSEVAKKADSKNGKKAMKALYDIRNEIKQAQKLEKQTQDREGDSSALSI